MNKYTLEFTNGQLETIYTKQEMPQLKGWVQKMSGVVSAFAVISLFYTIKAGTTNPKPYVFNFLVLGSAIGTILILQARPLLLNYIHTINCSIYMSTIIWQYTDSDFYKDSATDYLNGYIQGLATYVFISGTLFLPKLYLITLLFCQIGFCSGSQKFFSQFLQISPLWLLFIYKIYVDERTKRHLFLSQQQEQVYKYIIQNVLPTGLYLVKYDQKIERVELHSSNQKPKILSYLKTSDDIKDLLKKTVLARTEIQLNNLIKSGVHSWSDTLAGHLRRKIDQTLSWGEKRFISLKDRNNVRSKQGTIGNESDQQNSLGNYSFNYDHNTPKSTNAIPNQPTKPSQTRSESEINLRGNQYNQGNTQPQQSQYQNQLLKQQQQQQLSMSTFRQTFKNQQNQIDILPSSGHRLIAQNLLNSSPIEFLQQGGIQGNNSFKGGNFSNQNSPTKNNQTTSIFNNNNYGFNNSTPASNSNNTSQRQQHQQLLGTGTEFQRTLKPHQMIFSIGEVAQNLLVNSQNIETRPPHLMSISNRQSVAGHNAAQRQTSLAITQAAGATAGGSNPGSDYPRAGGVSENPYTDLVEYFYGVYSKNDDTQYKLNLRLSTFYLNDIYGVISIEDESFKDKFQQKERQYGLLLALFQRSIKEFNNQVVTCLYRSKGNNYEKNPSQADANNNNDVNMYHLLRLKCRLDNYNQSLMILSGASQRHLTLSECTEFSLVSELAPFFKICQQRALKCQVKMFVDFSDSLRKDPVVFTEKQMLGLLVHNVIFNAIENTPAKGTVAVRVSLAKENNQIKFKIFNMTLSRLDRFSLEKYHDPISLNQMFNDLKGIGKAQIGLRLSHRILQKLGPQSHIEYSCDYLKDITRENSSNNNYNNSSSNKPTIRSNSGSFNGNNANNLYQFDSKEFFSDPLSPGISQKVTTLFQTFYVYRDMQYVIQRTQHHQQNPPSSSLQNHPSAIANFTAKQSKINFSMPASQKKKLFPTVGTRGPEKKQSQMFMNIRLEKSQQINNTNSLKELNNNSLRNDINNPSGVPAVYDGDGAKSDRKRLSSMPPFSSRGQDLPSHSNIFAQKSEKQYVYQYKDEEDQSDILTYESNESFKQWIQGKQYNEYNKSSTLKVDTVNHKSAKKEELLHLDFAAIESNNQEE